MMLQQTQVATVIPYFEKFVRRFPDVQSLARAPLEQVLREWEGLGYYRRARMLHQAAQQIVSDGRGEIPQDIDELRSLPGIGRYSAGAILSIALNQRHPILEGNSRRVLARLFAVSENVHGGSGERKLWELAEQLVPSKRAGDFNQALMELGSQVCTSLTPDCRSCPVQKFCQAARTGTQERYPQRNKRPATTRLREVAVILMRRGSVLLRQCREGERWAGLWDFPRYPRPSRDLSKSLEQNLLRDFGLETSLQSAPYQATHTVTRFRIELTTFKADIVSGRLHRASGARWVNVREIGELPLNVTARKIARQLT